jgi:hypothetical protein
LDPEKDRKGELSSEFQELLRSYIDLYKRLSKVFRIIYQFQQSQYIGQYSLILSMILPICGKLLVNRKGDFNSIPFECSTTDQISENEVFNKTWRMQKFYRDPSDLFSSETSLSEVFQCSISLLIRPILSWNA